MGWLRSVGSIKLYVTFAVYRLFYRALLQKRPINLSTLLTVATPYEVWWTACKITVVYIFVYIYIYVHTYVYIYIYMFLYMYVYIYM